MRSASSRSVASSSSVDGAVEDLHSSGVGLLPRAVRLAEIDQARETVLAHLDLMKNTRPSPSSRHLAGFHQFPALEPLHGLITGNPHAREVMNHLLGPDHRTIGLSDITVNRSQQWHKDVLRGRFRHFLDGEQPCAQHHGKVFKVILYLQDSTSLHVVPGSHRQDVQLEDDTFAVPSDERHVTQVKTQAGDLVIIDICTTHRGSPETAFDEPQASQNPKMLISTVFGRPNCDFAERMERGNAERLAFWRRSNP